MHFNFLILGSGVAGMALAIRLSELGTVGLISKTALISGSTKLAQGGIAGVRDGACPMLRQGDDTHHDHFEDTYRVGAYHGKKEAIQLLVEKAPNVLEFLEKCGLSFDESLHQEAGHGVARVWHVADRTGFEIAKVLADRVRENANITVCEHTFATDLLVSEGVAHGVHVFHEGKDTDILGNKVILATGGGGQMYSETTSPAEVTGDGIAMALRAGAKCNDLEFVQFHPTALAREESPLFLLSEALRGSGAKVVNAMEKELCDSLIPRDELSRVIFAEQKKTGSHTESVFLDMRHQKNFFWEKNFPKIFAKLKEYHLSPETDLIPITPAAHFFCGGIETDLWGRTSIKNLSAVGEVAFTGVHGANRLASNSLLEGLVFAEQIVEDYQSQSAGGHDPLLPTEREGENSNSRLRLQSKYIPESTEDQSIRAHIQNICWEKVGIVRREEELKEAIIELKNLTPKGTETKNVQEVAIAVAEAALARKESLGCHCIDSHD